MTASQLIYFHRLEEENVAWSIKVEREERERRENNRALRLALQGEVVAEVSNKGAEQKPRLPFIRVLGEDFLPIFSSDLATQGYRTRMT